MSNSNNSKTKTIGISKILAIDPGLRNTGWAISTVTPGGKLRVLESGVLKHNREIPANVELILDKASDDTYIIIEEPPIIRVNLRDSHQMAQLYGAILAAALTSKARNVYSVLPKVWQGALLKEYNSFRNVNGFKKLVGDEKELVLSAIANSTITKREVVTCPHQLDCYNLSIYFCQKYAKTDLNTLKLGGMTDGLKAKTIKAIPGSQSGVAQTSGVAGNSTGSKKRGRKGTTRRRAARKAAKVSGQTGES